MKGVLFLSTFNKIDALLKEQGKKQKDLTDFLGVSKNRYTDWKNGRIKSYIKYIPQIADFLNVSADYLLSSASTEEDHLLLSEHEKILIKAYRAEPDIQKAIDRLLKIDEETLMREILSNTEVISITTKSKSKTKV